MSGRVIYLHGFGSSPASHKARYFRDRFHAIGIELEVPDLNQGDFEHLTITGQLALIERLTGGEPVSLIGSSLGGYLAAVHASLDPQVERMILLAPAFGFVRRFPQILGKARMDQWQQEGRLEFHHYGYGGPRKLHYAFYEDSLQYPDAPAFAQPALLFHGRHDTEIPANYSEQYCREHPNVKLEILDSDHQLLDTVNQIQQKIQVFLT